MTAKQFISIIIFTLLSTSSFCQNLKHALAGYVFNTLPTDRSIVGSKWVPSIGAVSSGSISEDKIISRSLGNYTFDKESVLQVQTVLRSILGIDAFRADEIYITIDSLEVETLRDLYSISLSENEMLVYEAIKATSIALSYNRSLEASVEAKIPTSYKMVEISAGGAAVKKISFNGQNLYVAHKIIKLDKITSASKSRKIDDKFKVSDIAGYNISFNNTKLINEVFKKLVENKGQEFADSRKYVGGFIAEYANAAPIAISILSTEKGEMTNGVFKKVIDFCYCKSFGDIDGRLFLINKIINGTRITFDYILIEDYYINYNKMAGARGLVTTYEPNKKSKVTVISKTYHIKNII
jgi:hypothetical protein